MKETVRFAPTPKARARSIAALVAGTVAALAALTAFVMAAQLTGQVLWFLGAILMVPAIWLASRRAAWAIRGAITSRPAVEIAEKTLVLPSLSPSAAPIEVPVRKVKAYSVQAQGSSAALMLWGPWVSHPAGYELVTLGCDNSCDAQARAEEIAQVFNDLGVAQRTASEPLSA